MIFFLKTKYTHNFRKFSTDFNLIIKYHFKFLLFLTVLHLTVGK